jgi:feruloyl esterase
MHCKLTLGDDAGMNRVKKTVFAALVAAATFCFAEKTDSLKVLMIGNSFSISATRHMPQVAKSMGLELDLASLYIGGCSLERHWDNCEKGKGNPDFKPYKMTRFVNGEKKEERPANVPEMLAVEKWDIVTIQQASHFSWKADSYHPFADDLIKKYIKELAPQAEVVVQETWSYTPWDKRLATWGIDQNEMYRKLHRAYFDYAASKGLRTIPMGTAVQLWRERLPVAYAENSFGGDVCGSAKFVQGADGKWSPKGDVFHLNRDGEYLQALVWTAKLFDADVTKCRYAPEGVDAACAAKMKEVAMAAVRGELPGESHGGTVVPQSVKAGIERLRSAPVKDCELRDMDWRSGALRVSFVLRPSAISFIRCEMCLADPENWDGRLWGHGNGGWAGRLSCPWTKNSATVMTDMGTSRYSIGTNPIDVEIRRDFGWRSTHLMTVAAKEFVKAYYGRAQHHSYFRGASTGGGQGMCEAQRFPEDYDGIISGVPALDRISLATPHWQRAQLQRKHGGKWFSEEERKAVREAELAYFAKVDPPAAHGLYIMDPRPTPAKLDACWKEIVGRNPALADREALWRGLFEPVYVKGRRAAPGQTLGIEFSGATDFLLRKIIGEKKYEDVTDDDMQRFIDDPDFNFRNPDLNAFAKRGGRIISYAGLEDTSVPYPPIVEYYDRAAGVCGGPKTIRDFYALYLLPGRKHNPKSGISGDPQGMNEKIVAWVENGEKPGAMKLDLTTGPLKTMEIAPY